MNNNDMPSLKKRLLRLLIANSFHYSKEKKYKLTSGKYSNYYIDSKTTTFDPEGMNLIGNILFEMISPLNVDAVGGLTLGADPISFAISMISHQKERPIRAFVVRKDAKGHGMKRSIEGNIEGIKKVVIVDDIITTGKSTLEAIDKAKKGNFSIVKAIALVDRQEGGKENIEKEGIPVEAIFTRDELMRVKEHEKK